MYGRSKAYGPDLRLAVLAGATDPVERVRAYRNFGAGWTSRILQDAAAHLLTDPTAQQQVATARTGYASRRQRLAAVLTANGLGSDNTDGLSVWLPVHNERYALVTLAAHRSAVSPGGRFFVGSGPPAHPGLGQPAHRRARTDGGRADAGCWTTVTRAR